MPSNASLVLAAIEKQFKVMGIGSFTSTFGKEAHADLIFYEGLRAKRAGRSTNCIRGPLRISLLRSSSATSQVRRSKSWMCPWSKLVALLTLLQRTLPLEKWLEWKRQNQSQIPRHLWMLMRQWTPMYQKALPLERYLVQRLRNRTRLGSHQCCILMILLVRSLFCYGLARGMARIGAGSSTLRCLAMSFLRWENKLCCSKHACL